MVAVQSATEPFSVGIQVIDVYDYFIIGSRNADSLEQFVLGVHASLAEEPFSIQSLPVKTSVEEPLSILGARGKSISEPLNIGSKSVRSVEEWFNIFDGSTAMIGENSIASPLLGWRSRTR